MQRLEKLVEPYAGLIVENYKRVLSWNGILGI